MSRPKVVGDSDGSREFICHWRGDREPAGSPCGRHMDGRQSYERGRLRISIVRSGFSVRKLRVREFADGFTRSRQ